ncbi:GNAT family N-acetyltransferase [Arsenicicoccus sp. oral taxon 190]|uniref:GNAT family N-acetyltransferase n=1 Tax=Arsenicicoccus sp. oral taxon 190 TaxID=1658671 RepID=UPI000679F44B|nr:GNAT family N-acetyltransferase [Arsenicicoccus sp. oral taxon 190]AKT51791.1 hypothetical protein ADJ73_11790 [Arsenicicoccus sp. oral taxon 190]
MSAPAHIRRARPHDAFAVAAMAVQIGRERGASPDPEFIDRFADSWLRAEGRHPFWLAEVEKRPLGIAGITLVEQLPSLGGARRARWAQVHTVFVTPTFRRCGIGGQLAREVFAWASAEGLTHLRGDLTELGPAAAGIARRLGARPTSEGSFESVLKVPATLF